MKKGTHMTVKRPYHIWVKFGKKLVFLEASLSSRPPAPGFALLKVVEAVNLKDAVLQLLPAAASPDSKSCFAPVLQATFDVKEPIC